MWNSLIPASILNYLWSNMPGTVLEQGLYINGQNEHCSLMKPSFQWENFDHLLINTHTHNLKKDTIQTIIGHLYERRTARKTEFLPSCKL